MSLIQIIAKNIELDFVKESLSIKIENNSLSREFKVSHSSYPFLIVENKKTKVALGTRELASVKKNKIIEVIVLEGGNQYYGELQVLSYLDGFRKCNLKYSSIILSIMNKKIADFMPVVSIIPDVIDPIPFSENSEAPVEGSQYWKSYPLPFLNKNFPEVKWQFPTMKWSNKFGINLDAEDPWYKYNGKINQYNAEGLIENEFTIVSDLCEVQNRNVVSPQIFLLAPAFYALQSLGFKISGNFVNSEFIKKILIYSNKTNLTETHPLKESENIIMNNFVENSSDEGTFYSSTLIITPTIVGTYVFDYEVDESKYDYDPLFLDRKIFQIFPFSDAERILYKHLPGDPAHVYKGTVKIEITDDLIGSNIYVRYLSPSNIFPNYSIRKKVQYSNTYFQMHPTIQLGRYLPDWTFGTYLNEMQNLFNLEIVPDDFTKKVFFNFNEVSILESPTYVEKKSLLMTSYEQTPYNAFLLKYDNDEDQALWITTNSVDEYQIQKSDFSETLRSKFKYVPVTYTAELSEGLDSKSGTGLLIYDPVNKPYISNDYLGQTLEMNGIKGIYASYFKKWLKFLLNSSAVELTGTFTEIEKNKIVKLMRIFIDHQEYIISTLECSETNQENLKIKFNLQSITF